MVFNTTFSNISAISWWLVLLSTRRKSAICSCRKSLTNLIGYIGFSRVVSIILNFMIFSSHPLRFLFFALVLCYIDDADMCVVCHRQMVTS